MKRREILRKLYALGFSGMLVMNGMSLTSLAASGSEVAADGTYTATAHVSRTDEDDEEENEWGEYDVKVSLTVEDGVFSEITVTGVNGYDESESSSYFKKATTNKKGLATLLEGEAATEDTIEAWDSVSSATRTSEAVKAAALEAIAGAPVASDGDDDSDDADSDGTDSGNTENPGGSDDSGSGADDQGSDSGSTDPTEDGGDSADDGTEEVTYVLMNIPYDEFYAADVNNDVAVDAFTSATKTKVRTGSLAGGSYHVDDSGDEITGITFPVKLVGDVDLSAYTQVTDSDSVEITVTNRGNTTTTVYEGADALFESASYSYYVLSEEPEYYKEVSVVDGELVFGEIQGTAATLSNIDVELSTESSYGDYQLSLDGLTDTISTSEKVYAVIIHTAEGSDYGLRHLENIWRVSELAWAAGFTEAVHNCPTSSAHYEAMMGQTITGVTYYAESGIYEIPVDGIYVPVKTGAELSVEDALISAGETAGAVDLPKDYDAEVTIVNNAGDDVTDQFTVTQTADGFTFTFGSDAKNGNYTVTITDKSGVYADITGTMTLIDDEMPVAYNNDNTSPALVTAEGSTDEKAANFIGNISSVSVNGTSYSASGRGAVVIINSDGTLNTEAAAFAEDGTYEITVSSTGYQDYSFTYVKKTASDDDSDDSTDDSKDDSGDSTDDSDKTDDSDSTDDVSTVDTAALAALITKAEGLTSSDYTSASWSVLEKVLSGAKRIYADPASQNDVDTAAAALTQAIADLQAAGTDSSVSGSTGTTGTTGSIGTTGSTGSTSTTGKTTGNASSNSTVAPKTGDVSLFGSIAAMISAMAVLAGVVLFRRRKDA